MQVLPGFPGGQNPSRPDAYLPIRNPISMYAPLNRAAAEDGDPRDNESQEDGILQSQSDEQHGGVVRRERADD